MTNQQQQIADQCAQQLKKGSLTEKGLREAFEAVATDHSGRQDLLYIQAAESSVASEALGIRMLIDGQYAEEPENDDDWPYNNVIDAINDGWRVISFPNMALSLDENRTYGLGFEFILEKRR